MSVSYVCAGVMVLKLSHHLMSVTFVSVNATFSTTDVTFSMVEITFLTVGKIFDHISRKSKTAPQLNI